MVLLCGFRENFSSKKTFVWIREDAVKKSLQSPYNGPFRVIDRLSDNLFSIDVSGKLTNVSTERLKPAFLPKKITSDPVIVNSPSNTVPSNTCHGTLKTYPGRKKKVLFAT